MLFNKKYCFKFFIFFFTPHEKIVIRTESWVKNRDTNRIVGLVYRYSPIGNVIVLLIMQTKIIVFVVC